MTLTELTYYVRKIFPLAVLGFILLFIFYIIYKIAELTSPPPQVAVVPTPTPAFGLITEPKFENTPKSPANKEYFLDTVSGVPETATASAKIAFIPLLTANFGFKEKASILAKELGFDEVTQETKLTDNLYTIVDKAKRLEFEVNTFNYTYTQDITSETKQVFAGAIMPSADIIKSKALDLMRKLSRYPEEVSQSTQTITYFAYKEASGSASTAEVVQDPGSANMVEVDFFPPKFNNFESVTPKYFTSPNYIVFVPQKNDKDVVMRAQIKVYEASKAQVSSYPLKSGDDAFAELTSGNGYLIAGNIDGLQRVNIKRMYTAYLYPDYYTQYLTPVYVFTGDNGFVAYVPAVSPLWVQK